jgi:hypothetical protein
MRRAVAAISLTAACSLAFDRPRTQPPTSASCPRDVAVGADAVLATSATAASVLVLFWPHSAAPDGQVDCTRLFCDRAPVAAALFMTASAFAISAVSGNESRNECRANAVARQQRIDEDAVREKRQQAWMITKSASQAARDGECAAVASASRAVKAIDADFHATVFLRDVAIARCVASDSRATDR